MTGDHRLHSLAQTEILQDAVDVCLDRRLPDELTRPEPCPADTTGGRAEAPHYPLPPQLINAPAQAAAALRLRAALARARTWVDERSAYQWTVNEAFPVAADESPA